jgi:hypothetical protein
MPDVVRAVEGPGPAGFVLPSSSVSLSPGAPRTHRRMGARWSGPVPVSPSWSRPPPVGVPTEPGSSIPSRSWISQLPERVTLTGSTG